MRSRADVRTWAWWRLPWPPRLYVGAAPLAMVALICYAIPRTTWYAADLWKFGLLLGCALVSVAATPRNAYVKSGMVRDFITAWVLPVAILLPPVYAMMMPIPLYLLTQWRSPHGFVYRRVFSAAAISLAYGAASVLFRAFPASFAGPSIGTGVHALTWTLAVAVCEIVGGRGHHFLIVGAIKLSDPSISLAKLELNREALQGDFAEFDLGVLITVVVAVNVVLAVFAVPTVLLARRFMMHAQLVVQSRIDSKTGLLNAATWESEAMIELARAVRTRTPLSIALVDIDHFKAVNDRYGHLAGDKALRAVTEVLRSHLRPYDLAGRFGGEEFALLLPHAREIDAINVAERLRAYIAAMAIPVSDYDQSAGHITLTISVGVAALDGPNRELADLLAAADAALYHAKETGRNKTHVIPAAAQAS
ncbi:MAG TPA: GGDEF domain-containing protein [Streptosporangiaceae bacterium]|nr:GGDEF domain-containing protein [Streptosporangiaceae bacterium]